MPKRFFTRTQKNTLFILANGLCQECGEPLGDDWHADHIIPWSKGGKTIIENGIAKCAKCNLKKGNRMEFNDEFQPRTFQLEMLNKANDNYNAGKKKVVAEIFCGGGKTAASQYVANDFYRKGYIDTVVVFTPRLNLCRQYELDWSGKKGIKRLFEKPRLGDIVHRPNKAPLLKKGDFGYVSTYQSLVSNTDIHLNTLSSRKYLLVIDEAQFLGIKGEVDNDIKATIAANQIAQNAEFIVVMTGTPLRSDDNKIWMGDYTDPDDKGRIKLKPDVKFTYRQGVAQEYLRRFDFQLVNGTATKLDLITRETQDYNTRNEQSSLYQILTHPEFYQPLIDKTIEKVRYTQLIDRRFCGLIGANNQKHAKDIIKYIREQHKGIKVLLAVSDENEAHANLELFKRGNYDILVTVQMAYIGYSYKPITVVCPLTSIRFGGWLDQFFMRGGRIWDEVNYDDQWLYGIVPDDPKMVAYAEKLRSDSEEGFKEKEAREKEEKEHQGNSNGENEKQQKMEVLEDIAVSEGGGMGIDSRGDTDGQQFYQINKAIQNNKAAISVSGFVAIAKEVGITWPNDNIESKETVSIKQPIDHTKKDREDALRSTIRNAVNGNVVGPLVKLYGSYEVFKAMVDFAYVSSFLNKQFGIRKIEQCNEEILLDMLVYAKSKMLDDIKAELVRIGKL